MHERAQQWDVNIEQNGNNLVKRYTGVVPRWLLFILPNANTSYNVILNADQKKMR